MKTPEQLKAIADEIYFAIYFCDKDPVEILSRLIAEARAEQAEEDAEYCRSIMVSKRYEHDIFTNATKEGLAKDFDEKAAALRKSLEGGK